jgi:hypothetical protein
MGARIAKGMLGATLGVILLGPLAFYLAYNVLQQTGMGGGMEGLGRAYQCLFIGVGGAAIGAVFGGAIGFGRRPTGAPERQPLDEKGR